MADLFSLKDYRALPGTVEELISTISEIFDEYRGRVTKLLVEAGEPIRFEYVGDGGETGRGDPQPYDILRVGTIEEYREKRVREPSAIVLTLMQVLCVRRAPPVCVLVKDAAMWEWLGFPEGLLAGFPVYYEKRVPAYTIVIAGGRDPNLGVGGLTHGIKYVWGP